MIGKILNQKWEVGAKHALFHKDGFWYHKLERFPGAYFDSAGYVLFNSEEEFASSPHLSISKTVWVIPGTIRYMPNYKKMDKEPLFQAYSSKKFTLWRRFRMLLAELFGRVQFATHREGESKQK